MHGAPPEPRTAADLLADRARRPERVDQATLSEVFAAAPQDGAATGFVFSQLDPKRGPVLWVSDRLSRTEGGMLCIAGLPRPVQVIAVKVNRPVDVLWAMEQGLGCASLGAVVGEVWGDPQQLDFTASKRLALRSEAHAVPAWLIRRAAHPNLSAARDRWHIGSLPSLTEPDDTRAPGQPLWQAERFRSRWGAVGHWVARDNGPDQGLHFDHRTEVEGITPREEAV